MKNKEILQINQIDPGNSGQIGQLADLYADVFAGPPWNEVTKCASTGSFYGSDTTVGSPCPDCQTPLLEAYPREETIRYILGELGKSNPIGLLAFVNNELAGFSWGYQTDVNSLAMSKWKTPKMQEAVKSLLVDYGVTDKLFYGSETGVDPKFQGKGLGKKLVTARLNRIISSNERYALVRTNVNSPMYGIINGSWIKGGMDGFTQILGPVADTKFWTGEWQQKNTYINMLDSENPERVLFLFDKKRYENIQKQPTPGQLMSAGW